MRRVILVLLFLMLLGMISSPALGWWDSSWDQRKELTVTENSGTDLQLYPVIAKDVDIGPAAYDSIRVVHEPSGQSFGFGLNKTGSSTFDIAFKANVSASSSNSSYYVYYSNSGASSANITWDEARNNWFEGWESYTAGTNIPSWLTETQAGCSNRGVDSSLGPVLEGDNAFFMSWDCNDGGQDTIIEGTIPGLPTKSDSLEVGYHFRTQERGALYGQDRHQIRYEDSSNGTILSSKENDNNNNYMDSQEGTTNISSNPHDTWYRYVARTNTSTPSLYENLVFYKDVGNGKNRLVSDTTQQGKTGSIDYLYLRANGFDSADFVVDNLFARYYVSPEPSVSIGSEEVPNSAPSIGNATPVGVNRDPSGGVELSVEVDDPESDDMNITFYNNSDDAEIESLTGVGEGVHSVTWNSLSEDSTHSWYADVTDGSSTSSISANSFTTLKLDLNWNDNSDNEDGFKIYSNASGSFNLIGQVSSGVTSYGAASAQLSSGVYTCYRVKAYNTYGESSPASGCVTP